MSSSPWAIGPDDAARYQQMWQVADVAGRGKVAAEESGLSRSGLPVPVLQTVWTLADRDQDGALTRAEFYVACHIITLQLTLQLPMPAAVPPELLVTAAAATGGAPQAMGAA